MERNASGSVWRIDLSSGARECLASGLACPCGMVAGADGVMFVSESWRHRVVC